LLICGGGTGGHIYPALAVVTELRRQGANDQFLWIGTKGEIEEKLVPDAGLPLTTISGGGIAGLSLWRKLLNGMKLMRGIIQANQAIGHFQPDVLFMTGGYVNIPVALAARWRRRPLVVYLPDIEPGRAIRFVSRLASKIACTTPASDSFLPAAKLVVTGYPVRAELRAAVAMPQAEALAQFDLQPGRPTLFVFGGSRGARSINQALTVRLPDLLADSQVIHISGELDWPQVAAQAADLPAALQAYYRPFPYLHEQMAPAFRAADLVVARAGASMLGECPAFGLPAVLVPYPYAWRYQKVNADYLADRGAAVRLNNEDLAEQLLPTVRALLHDPARLAAMSAAAKALDRPDAAQQLAHLLRQHQPVRVSENLYHS
jgi:undecaprenyldiphospho-muramoylpentapeptide beta-N-acetylglucosaminyltransferase